MDKLLKSILETPAIIRFLSLVKDFNVSFLRKVISNQIAEPSLQPNLNVLNCRVQLKHQQRDNFSFDAFNVEICGTINAPSNMHHMSVRISITDITSKELPVHSCVAKWQMDESPVFCYISDLGKLSSARTTLSSWITVAQVKLDWLRFPRRGKRNLRFSTSILSCEGDYEIARAGCTFTYDNSAFGYIDFQENIQRVKTLTVVLGFAVSACDNKLYNCEVELLKNWARINFGVSQASRKVGRKLEKALNKTLAFCLNGNKIDAYKICKEIVELVPVAERYDILDLCLHVAQAKGAATVEELLFLRKLESWLEVDADKFSSMIEKILPVNIHEIKDAEIILGVTPDMSKEQTRRYLNKVYRKWNARVTNFDPKIQAQADCMLKFIAEARRAHVG
jgi:hypothetical protein